jgi:hypothetical protein
MNVRRHRIGTSLGRIVVGGALVVVAGCGLAASGVADDSRTAAVGRIVDLDANHGFAIVEFPERRMFVHLGKRDMDKYLIGDDLRIDSYGRPLPPRPRTPHRARPS